MHTCTGGCDDHLDEHGDNNARADYDHDHSHHHVAASCCSNASKLTTLSELLPTPLPLPMLSRSNSRNT